MKHLHTRPRRSPPVAINWLQRLRSLLGKFQVQGLARAQLQAGSIVMKCPGYETRRASRILLWNLSCTYQLAIISFWILPYQMACTRYIFDRCKLAILRNESFLCMFWSGLRQFALFINARVISVSAHMTSALSPNAMCTGICSRRSFR